jgi:hypothetical protein
VTKLVGRRECCDKYGISVKKTDKVDKENDYRKARMCLGGNCFNK